MVWLAIDLGEARVGLALSDPELTFAHPLGNIEVHGDSFRALDTVVDLVLTDHIERVVVGLPLQLDGSEGKSAKKARRWVSNLLKRMQAVSSRGVRMPEVTLVDERLTTVTAHHQLQEAELAAKRHRPIVDQQSAVLILQSVLDHDERARRGHQWMTI